MTRPRKSGAIKLDAVLNRISVWPRYATGDRAGTIIDLWPDMELGLARVRLSSEPKFHRMAGQRVTVTIAPAKRKRGKRK